MNRRVTPAKHHQTDNRERTLKVKGVYVLSLLVCGLLCLNGILIYAIFFSSHGLPGYKLQNEQVRQMEERILALKQQNQRLFEMIQAIKTDPKAQERLVRQELGWVRENEVVLEFPDTDDKPRGQNQPVKQPLPRK